MAAKSGEKTNFTVACGLLSQLVKEKGSIVNLNLGKHFFIFVVISPNMNLGSIF